MPSRTVHTVFRRFECAQCVKAHSTAPKASRLGMSWIDFCNSTRFFKFVHQVESYMPSVLHATLTLKSLYPTFFLSLACFLHSSITQCEKSNAKVTRSSHLNALYRPWMMAQVLIIRNITYTTFFVQVSVIVIC